MCSVLAILGLDPSEPIPRERALALSRLQRHRGPDWSGIHAHERAVLAHNRLAIVDVEHGAQPLRSPDGSHILAVNGEIYNHRELEAGLERPYEFQTRSDCEVILALYAEEGTAFLDRLNGIFAFVLYDADADRHIVARDHIGIVPLYTGHDEEGRFYVASEMKALTPVCRTVSEFPPGHVLDSADGTPRRYYRRPWRSHTNATADPSPPRSAKRWKPPCTANSCPMCPTASCCPGDWTRRSSRPSRSATPATGSRTTTGPKHGGPASIPSASGWRDRRIWPPPGWWPTTSAPSITSSNSPCRKESTRSPRQSITWRPST